MNSVNCERNYEFLYNLLPQNWEYEHMYKQITVNMAY